MAATAVACNKQTGCFSNSTEKALQHLTSCDLDTAVLSLHVPTLYPHRSHLPPVRSTAAAALLQFLLDYPLSPSRLQGHMLFLLTNTSYKHEEGRLQALEMLQQVGGKTGSAGHRYRLCVALRLT